jgi:preprotein translocase subunit SecD
MMKPWNQLFYSRSKGCSDRLLGDWFGHDGKPFQGNRLVCSAAAISLLTVACVPRLKDYTQVTMQAMPLKGDTVVVNDSAKLSADSLEQTQAILENRLNGLGIETAEIETLEPDRIVVRLPQTVNAQATEAVLTNPGQLHLRNQKTDTEAELASKIEDLQRLLVEQNTLAQTNQPDKADALQSQVDDTRSAISALFEPSKVTGETLLDARAKPSSESNDIWEVNIQFDAQGTKHFAEQTKQMAGTGRAIGLFLDDVLLSAPVVDVAYAVNGITGGTAVIAGHFTQIAAKELEVQLKSGALPVTLNTVEVTSTADSAK